MPERLVVVHNPNSTHGSEVESSVFHRLDDAAIRYEKVPSVSSIYEDNVDVFAKSFRPGDRILVAAGDGTASQAVNGAILSGELGIEMAFEPFGNFNDLAASYNGAERVVDPLRLVNSHASLLNVRPVRVEVNDEPWRYALGYSTVGWTAAATDLFMNGELRESLKRQHKHLVTARSIANLFAEYYKRRHDMALPHYLLNGSREIRTDRTDIVALNTRRMGRIIRLHAARPDSDKFAYAELNVESLLRNRRFLARAALGTMPADVATSQRIEFCQPASQIPIQTEGEFALLKDISRLTFTKDHNEAITVVIPRTDTIGRNE
jgi:hypothetical protein